MLILSLTVNVYIFFLIGYLLARAREDQGLDMQTIAGKECYLCSRGGQVQLSEETFSQGENKPLSLCVCPQQDEN